MRIATCFKILAVCWLLQLANAHTITDQTGAASVPSAGIVGNYAGSLVGGKTLSELGELEKGESFEVEATAEEHGFSEAAAEESHEGEYEHSDGFGDHLQEEHFPADYGVHQEHDAHEFEETEAAASEYQHADIGSLEKVGQHDFHFNEIGGADDDFLSKAVPGIDHGKGAFSYSTSYEFQDPPKEHSW